MPNHLVIFHGIAQTICVAFFEKCVDVAAFVSIYEQSSIRKSRAQNYI